MSIVENTNTEESFAAEKADFNPFENYESIEVIERFKAVESHKVKDVCDIQIDRLKLSDGSIYLAQIIEPIRKKSDVVFTFTTPLYTSLGGLNTYLGIEAAREGISSVGISNEQPDFLRSIRNIGRVTIAHDALVHHLALDSIETDGRFEPKRSINGGYSRGAMVGFGIEHPLLEKMFNRKIEYNDFIDPCLEHRPTLKALNPIGLLPYLESETAELVKCLRNYKSRDLRHLVKTLPKKPSQVIQHGSTLSSLWSGEAGDLADDMDKDTPIHLTLYNGSIFNHSAEWNEKFSNNFRKIHINNSEGSHLTGFDPVVIGEMVGRVSLVGRLLNDGASREDIDPKFIGHVAS